jgi:hypothetical protein
MMDKKMAPGEQSAMTTPESFLLRLGRYELLNLIVPLS